MNQLIIYAHPNPKSFNNAIKENLVQIGTSKGMNTVVRDLYEMNFDPILKPSDIMCIKKKECPIDINIEHEHIKWADVIVFVFPLWWNGMPAIMKGYVDRIFSYGFAYNYDKHGSHGLLTDKKVVVLTTLGETDEVYSVSGLYEAVKMTQDMGIFEFCGMQVLLHHFFPAVPHVDRDTRLLYLEELKHVYSEALAELKVG